MPLGPPQKCLRAPRGGSLAEKWQTCIPHCPTTHLPSVACAFKLSSSLWQLAMTKLAANAAAAASSAAAAAAAAATAKHFGCPRPGKTDSCKRDMEAAVGQACCGHRRQSGSPCRCAPGRRAECFPPLPRCCEAQARPATLQQAASPTQRKLVATPAARRACVCTFPPCCCTRRACL